MATLWKTKNEAVKLLNEQLAEAGHDLAASKPGLAIYGGIKEQQAVQLATFALLPDKHHREAPRVFGHHLKWLGHARRDPKTGWPLRYEAQEGIAFALSLRSPKAVMEATASLTEAGLLEKYKKRPAPAAVPVNHYLLGEAAHVVLALLGEAGAMALDDARWRELLSPADPKDKALRDVLDGWQKVAKPDDLAALRAAVKQAVDRVQDDAGKLNPRAFHEAYRAAFKAAQGYDPGPYSGKEAGQAKAILQKLKAMGAEPDAGFTFSKNMSEAFAADMVKRWDYFAAAVKAAKGFSKVPEDPDLGFLSLHMGLAVKLYLGAASPDGW